MANYRVTFQATFPMIDETHALRLMEQLFAGTMLEIVSIEDEDEAKENDRLMDEFLKEKAIG